jgi:flagellar basal body-associated protein FliL
MKGNINTGLLIIILLVIVAGAVYWMTSNSEKVEDTGGTDIKLNLDGSSN